MRNCHSNPVFFLQFEFRFFIKRRKCSNIENKFCSKYNLHKELYQNLNASDIFFLNIARLKFRIFLHFFLYLFNNISDFSTHHIQKHYNHLLKNKIKEKTLEIVKG